MTWLRSADASMVWAFEAARISLIVFACAAASWAAGFGMGYPRGVNDAITGGTGKPDHQVEGARLDRQMAYRRPPTEPRLRKFLLPAWVRPAVARALKESEAVWIDATEGGSDDQGAAPQCLPLP
jgi:hypothetical protein